MRFKGRGAIVTGSARGIGGRLRIAWPAKARTS